MPLTVFPSFHPSPANRVLSALETFLAPSHFSQHPAFFFYGLFFFLCALLPRMVIAGESPQLKLNPPPHHAPRNLATLPAVVAAQGVHACQEINRKSLKLQNWKENK